MNSTPLEYRQGDFYLFQVVDGKADFSLPQTYQRFVHLLRWICDRAVRLSTLKAQAQDELLGIIPSLTGHSLRVTKPDGPRRRRPRCNSAPRPLDRPVYDYKSIYETARRSQSTRLRRLLPTSRSVGRTSRLMTGRRSRMTATKGAIWRNTKRRRSWRKMEDSEEEMDKLVN